MARRGIASLLALLALATTAAACGGGGGGGSEGSTAATTSAGSAKAEFIAAADAICKAEEAKQEKEVAAYLAEEGVKGEPNAKQELAIVARYVIPAVNFQAQKIAKLTPPPGEEKEVGAILAALDRGVEIAEVNPRGVLNGENPFGPAGKKAKAYGMKVCGS